MRQQNIASGRRCHTFQHADRQVILAMGTWTPPYHHRCWWYGDYQNLFEMWTWQTKGHFSALCQSISDELWPRRVGTADADIWLVVVELEIWPCKVLYNTFHSHSHSHTLVDLRCHWLIRSEHSHRGFSILQKKTCTRGCGSNKQASN